MNKYYYEKYALLAICHILNLKIENFEHRSDRPDLQSNKYDMGIEVVQAITQQQGLTNSLVNCFFGQNLPGELIVDAINKGNKKGKFTGTIRSVNDIAAISPTQELYDIKMHKDLVVEKIKKKSKLFKNYAHYGNNGLFCFTQTSLIDESDYADRIRACKESAFSFVFVDCIDEILAWNTSSDILKTYKISSECLCKWEQDAKNHKN